MDKKGSETKIITVLLIFIFWQLATSFYMMVKTIPFYSYYFDMLGGTLPLITLTYLNLSYFVRSTFIFLLPMCIGAFALLGLGYLSKNKKTIIKVYAAIVLILLISNILSHIAIGIPMKRLERLMEANDREMIK